jgi:hypothetical protein
MLQITTKLNVSSAAPGKLVKTGFSRLITFGQSKFNGHYADAVLQGMLVLHGSS